MYICLKEHADNAGPLKLLFCFTQPCRHCVCGAGIGDDMGLGRAPIVTSANISRAIVRCRPTVLFGRPAPRQATSSTHYSEQWPWPVWCGIYLSISIPCSQRYVNNLDHLLYRQVRMSAISSFGSVIEQTSINGVCYAFRFHIYAVVNEISYVLFGYVGIG